MRSVNQIPVDSCDACAAQAEENEVVKLFGFSWNELEEYTARLMTATQGEGSDYSYGSLLSGGFPVMLAPGDEWSPDGRFGQWAFFECTKCPPGTTTFDMAWSTKDYEDLEADSCFHMHCPRGHVLGTSDLRAIGPMTRSGYPPPLLAPDQIADLDEGLRADPFFRGHFLTPWHPSRFSGSASKGRPCLVGIQFRAVPGEAKPSLHCTVTFRSHDVYSAYPQNIAAVCLWLCRLAEKHDMGVGTVTCLSVSAHLYDRDWSAAQTVVDAHKPPAIRWDQRASWRVEKVEIPQPWPEVDDVISYVHRSQDVEYAGEWRIDGYNRDDAGERVSVGLVPVNVYPEGHGILRVTTSDLNGIRPWPQYELRATALTPDGSEVLGTFEGRNPENLARVCVESGLITETGAAVWLGREIERVWRGW